MASGNGNDIVDGGTGNDVIDGGNGSDVLYGGAGNDSIVGGTGTDTIFGGSGNDTIGMLVNGLPVNDTGVDTIYGDGLEGHQQGLAASMGNDRIYGGNSADVIYGDNGMLDGDLAGTAGGGADTIYGGNGNDMLFGEGGADMLNGGQGADMLSGGLGTDKFVYAAAAESTLSGMDTISDFQGIKDPGTATNLDKIDLVALLGAQDLAWGGTTPRPNGVWYSQVGGNTFVWADVTGDGTAELAIKLVGLHDLTNNDFLGVANNAPVITSNGGGASASLSINENSTAVTTVTANDPDSGSLLQYSIVGGSDSSKFTIDANTGALSFVSAPDREAATDSNGDSVYEVTVRVSDGAAWDDQTINVTVTDVDEFDVTTPVDNDGAANEVNENALGGTTVGIMAFASDDDATTNAVSYSLDNDAGGRFVINASTGEVSVAVGAVLDREADGASYNIVVRATSADTSTATQGFTIALNDVNDNAPVVTTAAAQSVNENTAFSVALTSTDADTVGTNPAVFSITGGSDAGLFSIDGSGHLTLAAQDFENPLHDHTYEVQVTANDGANTTNKTIIVTVNDVLEGDPNDFDAQATSPTAVTMTSGGAGNDTVLGSAFADVLFGGGGDDTLYGGAGSDELRGDGGADKLYGGSGDDRLFGDAGVDEMYGGSGNDRIDAGAAADVVILGGLGNDTIIASAGADVISGGDGSDTFVFNSLAGGFAADSITDFNANGVDQIALVSTVFTALTGGTTTGLDSDEFRANAGGTALDGNDYILFDTLTGALYYDSNGNVGGGRTQIATLTVTGTFDYTDFTVVPPPGP